jgi:pilus assembly protein CpaB
VRSKTFVMLGLALVFGVLAVFVAQRWLDYQSSRLQATPVAEAPPPAVTIVVAAVPLRFGMEIARQHLREISWSPGSLPKGAFSSIDEVLDGKNRRVALAAIEENEAILRTKITGPGQRASLAAVIDPGMKAVTVRVNDVNGVAGFVLPGERVDVILTRTVEKEDSYSDVLLQNMKVLAVDQMADERSDKPSLVKAVTLEASTPQAQRLTLASTVGTLSLALRAAGQTEVERTERVGVADLLRDAAKPGGSERGRTTVSVARALKRHEYSVPVQTGQQPGLATSEKF